MMKKRGFALFLALIFALALLSMTASAASPKLLAEFFPTGKPETPRAPYMVLESDTDNLYGDALIIWYNTPHDILELQKAYGLWETETDFDDGAFRERFGVEAFEIWIQTDCRIDGGAWQYTKAWDSPDWSTWDQETMPSYLAFCADSSLNTDIAKAFDNFTLSWLIYIEDGNTGFLDPGLTSATGEYGEPVYHFDTANHTFSFRCRMMLKYAVDSGGEWKALCSDWSPETSIGRSGTQKPLSAPTAIEAPAIDSFAFRVDVDEGSEEQFTSADYYLNIPDSVYDGLLYCEAQEGMFEPYRIEAQLRVNGGEWGRADTGNETWIFSAERSVAPDTGTMTEKDQVELRVRLVCEELGLASPWSNIIGNKPDFVAHNWAKPELEEAAALGLIPGCLQGADLTQPITRAEFAAVSVKLYEALSGTQAEPVAANPFTDTSDPEVLKAFDLGVTNGTAADKFDPDALINREQAAAMLTRVYKKLNLEGWTLASDGEYKEAFKALFTMPALFADDGEISSWAKDSVYFMAANGIVNGVGDNCFAPKLVSSGEETLNFATREQALLMSVRTVKNLG